MSGTIPGETANIKMGSSDALLLSFQFVLNNLMMKSCPKNNDEELSKKLGVCAHASWNLELTILDSLFFISVVQKDSILLITLTVFCECWDLLN